MRARRAGAGRPLRRRRTRAGLPSRDSAIGPQPVVSSAGRTVTASLRSGAGRRRRAAPAGPPTRPAIAAAARIQASRSRPTARSVQPARARSRPTPIGSSRRSSGAPPRRRVPTACGLRGPSRDRRGQRDRAPAARAAGPRDRRRIVLQDRGDQGGLARAREGLAAGRHLVEHGAEREDVGPRVGFFSFELLGRHVLERAEDRSRLRHGRGLCRQDALQRTAATAPPPPSPGRSRGA